MITTTATPTRSVLALGRTQRVRHTVTKHALRQLTCQVKQITNEEIAELPWASPGWRGAYVSSQPKATQAAIMAGVTILGAALTYFAHTVAGPWLCSNVPLLNNYMQVAPYIYGPFIAAVGTIHFSMHKKLCGFYPPRGTWGFWYLPGSPSFHVWWTGVAEILGGLGMVLGALRLDLAPHWLLRASSFGLFLLVIVVSPSNLYMWTHNAPGPLDEEALEKMPGKVIPLHLHLLRGAMQVLLLATFLGLALST